jgi:LCP family protein required for cell wall assembly
MTKRLLAIIGVLSLWVAVTVAVTVRGDRAVAQTAFAIERAHADYAPALDGSDPIFILILGSDARPGTPVDQGIGDSIHILGINPEARRATLFGFPRDSYVPLSTGGTNRINAALPAGGPPAMVDTVEALTGITLDYYVLTGFDEIVRIVNDLGGFIVDVPYAVGGYWQTYEAGKHRLDGRGVLDYVRARHSLPLGDFNRSMNQGVVLQSALAQFRSETAKDPSRLYAWLGAGLRNTQTSVPLEELLRLAGLAKALAPSRVTNLIAMGSTGMQNGQSIVTLSGDNQALWRDLAADGYIVAKNIPDAAQPNPT